MVHNMCHFFLALDWLGLGKRTSNATFNKHYRTFSTDYFYNVAQ